MEQAESSPSAPAHHSAIRSKRRDWIEIGIAYALIEAVEWTPRPWQRGLWLIAALGIAFILCRSVDGWAAMGFRTANLWRSAWIIAAAAALSAAAMLISARAHALLMVDGFWVFPETYGAYAIWSAVQQILLQGFFLLRLLRVVPKPWQAALARGCAVFRGAYSQSHPHVAHVHLGIRRLHAFFALSQSLSVNACARFPGNHDRHDYSRPRRAQHARRAGLPELPAAHPFPACAPPIATIATRWRRLLRASPPMLPRGARPARRGRKKFQRSRPAARSAS